ncbi:NAD(P)/FAD-dependent oxidoreductase [Paenibacillus glucanolyticus]|jgi:thioredoxin reductase|uniref:Ferredoxin--NADP reductase n=1 Tax=Paenibacillus glucanolyticus TaxID=59843 RepID=A0A163H4P5_9BACL|nr:MULTISPECIES: NAD(P)/FAD-dependent oxidoreductase [Paenibacillus]ANA79374.1 ferredoxin--NADP(+) reductase [Paenibacillus glucanolyticus]AVV56680.1 NAD(P)/FAD-dependent oxidoreductase [Paenibacillus glucanolyticus]KZS45318.1 ferredoxin--NADP(+) reductase [Paenibacillus glucanolyticus]MDH6673433.1 thioredoxin reductase [Paenibacillus sp. LBL]MPY18730.1 NAD(P)/FAD-dependent oxidoreductase [Paenibacillus glucanolyticus]
MTTMPQDNNMTDLLIIGGGPAGMFAAFYGGMRQASVKLIESMPQLGGQLAALYPEKYIYDVAGFPKVTAQELVNNLSTQMELFQTDIRLEEKVQAVEKLEERHFVVKTDLGEHHAKAVIITAGVGAFQPRRLEVEGAEKYEKSNLHYFVNDLSRFKGKKVLISGGGDSAVDWALMIEPIAEQVTLVHRRDKFRAHEHSVEQLLASKVNIITPTEITELFGEEAISKVTLSHIKTKETQEIEVDDVIVNFGFVSSLGPISEWGIAIESNSIVVDSRMETSIPGIFAAGDITTYPGKVKLIAVGFGEAPTAVNNAKVYFDPEARLAPGHSSNMKL